MVCYTWPCDYLLWGSRKDPASAPTLASALASLAKSSSAPTFKGGEFFDLVNDALAGLHFKFLDDEDKPQDYGPHNPHLLESLLSGLSLKHGFSITHDVSWAIVHGLSRVVRRMRRIS